MGVNTKKKYMRTTLEAELAKLAATNPAVAQAEQKLEKEKRRIIAAPHPRAVLVEEIARWLAQNAMESVTQSPHQAAGNGAENRIIANAVRKRFG